ncbi:hypothetical protein GQ607_012939 [Colletotrichum asianum]|uniref:Uncharacterized protein n=1 Tax=Colletotrichum asianum TaxID=702518 RepID=A0A8H3ZLA6_9PEZI|nr:hypothetical protein GQ607_012939 [Colletotrichum asianum]
MLLAPRQPGGPPPTHGPASGDGVAPGGEQRWARWLPAGSEDDESWRGAAADSLTHPRCVVVGCVSHSAQRQQQRQSVHEYGMTTTDSGRGTATTCLFCPRDESQGRFTWETADAWMHFPTKSHHGLLPITTASCEVESGNLMERRSTGTTIHFSTTQQTQKSKQARSENKVRLIGADGVKHVRLNLGRISQIKGANRSASWAVNLPTPALDSLPPNAITI